MHSDQCYAGVLRSLLKGVAHTSNSGLLSVSGDGLSLLSTLEVEELSSEEDRSLGASLLSVGNLEFTAEGSWLVEYLVEAD